MKIFSYLVFSFFVSFGNFHKVEAAVNSNIEEPAIQGLSLDKFITLKSQSIIMNEHMSPNQEITTQSGMQVFFPSNDGILVQNPGLYRISFFQGMHTNIASQCIVFLKVTPGDNEKRYQDITLVPNSSGEINFTQILRLAPGQKVQVIICPISGEIFLHSGFDRSGLTIEKISS